MDYQAQGFSDISHFDPFCPGKCSMGRCWLKHHEFGSTAGRYLSCMWLAQFLSPSIPCRPEYGRCGPKTRHILNLLCGGFLGFLFFTFGPRWLSRLLAGIRGPGDTQYWTQVSKASTLPIRCLFSSIFNCIFGNLLVLAKYFVIPYGVVICSLRC